MTLTRLCLLMLLVAAILSLTIRVAPAIFSDESPAVPVEDLMRLNPV